MPDKSLILKNVSFAFEPESSVEIFHELSAEIPLKGVTLILGANASGKTTLARIIAGFETPLAGQVLWPDDLRVGDPDWTAPRVGVVFEEPDFQLQTFELGDEISIGLLHCGASQAKRERRMAEVAAGLGLEEALDKPLDWLEREGKLAALCASFAALSPLALVLDFSPLAHALENNFRERLFALSRAGECPALICLSREAEDMAFLEPDEKAFLLHDGRMEELSPDPGNAQLLDHLINAGIRLPWYFPLARALNRWGRLERLLYPGSDAFLDELGRITPSSTHGKGPVPRD